MEIISFNTLYSKCQSITGDSTSASLTLFKYWLNRGIQKAYGILDTEYFNTSATDATADGTSSYPLPYNCEKMHSLKVTIGTKDYVVVEYPGDENSWIALCGGTSTASESTYPTYYFPKRNTYEIWPTSSTDSYTITLRFKRNTKNLSQDDYTTGTIKTLANGGTAVTGDSTSWTAAFVGRYFKIDADGYWYEITARTSNTAITLAREYGGTAIAAGSESYTIGEASLLPEGYQDLPLFYTLFRYFKFKKRQDIATDYRGDWESGLANLAADTGNLTTSGVLAEDITIIDSNQWPSGLS